MVVERILEAALQEYLWMAIVGSLFGFIYAFGIGANDVANSFASVVASKSLTLRQAVVVAGIFEFAGALLLGASVTSTVKGKIFSVSLYKDEPELVMLGMFCSLITGSIMLIGATAFGLPVSTTHTIVGCIMGFTIVAKGFESVDWETGKKIFVSWAVSPLVSGFLSFLFFYVVKYFIMQSEDVFNRAYYTFPIVIMVGVGINVFYVLYKGMNNMDFADKLELKWVVPVSWGFGAVLGAMWLVVGGPQVRAFLIDRKEQRRLEAEKTKDVDPEKVVDVDGVKAVDGDSDESPTQVAGESGHPLSFDAEAAGEKEGILTKLNNLTKQDLEKQSLHESKRAGEIWDSAERFDEDAEYLFSYIQIFTSCLNSFAHGANDVANAIAPMSAIISIYQDGEVESKTEVQKWILAYGGAGLVVGFLFFGYRTIKSIGYKLTMLSASRGACAELASSLFIVTASFLEIPVSSTQCICGAVSGVGLVGGFRQVQWLFLLRVCISWAVVFFAAVIINAGVFSMFAFSPKLE